MKIVELRRNSDLYTKPTIFSFLKKYSSNPNAYLHTAPIPKIGIYPLSSNENDTPTGIFAYRIQDIWYNILNARRMHDDILSTLPYYGGNHLFIIESDIDPDIVGSYTDDNLEQDKVKMMDLYNISRSDIENYASAAKTMRNFKEFPISTLWGMTKAYAFDTFNLKDKSVKPNLVLWSKVLRALGYKGFNDMGFGYIHKSEPTQAIFLTKSAFTIKDYMNSDMSQERVFIDGIEYKGGRLPKNLYMKTIPDDFRILTQHRNRNSKLLSGVREWTVGNLNWMDLGYFSRAVPWNTKGIIKHLNINNIVFETLLGNLEDQFNTHIPENIEIENIVIDDAFPSKILKLIPPNFPVENIIISTPKYTRSGFDDVSPEILKKITAV